MADMTPPDANNPPNLHISSSSSDDDHDQHISSRASSVLSEPPSPSITSPPDNLRMLRSRSNRRAPIPASDSDDDGEDDAVSADLEVTDCSFTFASGKKRKASAKKGRSKGNKNKRAKRGDQAKTKKQIKEEQAELKRKSRLAKVAVCRDLPDWGARKDAPLMKLPSEILDRCFGTCQDLSMRDWLSLAGVNKFFRHHLDDTFFWEIWYLESKRDKLPEEKNRELYNPVTKQKTSIPNRPDGHPGLRPFTHDVAPWWTDPAVPKPLETTDIRTVKDPSAALYALDDPMTYVEEQHIQPPHYFPRGMRSGWSRMQYTIYKEEKANYNEKERKRRVGRAEKAAKHAAIRRRNAKVQIERWHWREGNLMEKSIIFRVRGREDGDEPPKKYAADEDERVQDESGNCTTADVLDPATPDPSESTKTIALLGPEASFLWEAAKVPRWLRGPSEPWECPETDGEDDLEYDSTPRYDDSGSVIPDDYWPSKWRKLVAAEISDTWVCDNNFPDWNITEAELISLKHVFLSAAVEALAYRVHGGYTGYLAMIAERKRLEEERRRQERIAKRDRRRDACKARGEHFFPVMGKYYMAQEGGKPSDWCRGDCWCHDDDGGEIKSEDGSSDGW